MLGIMWVEFQVTVLAVRVERNSWVVLVGSRQSGRSLGRDELMLGGGSRCGGRVVGGARRRS